MSETVDRFPADTSKQVTVLTDELIVYQGTISPGPRKHDDVSTVTIAGPVGVDADVRPRFLDLALHYIPFLLYPNTSGALVHLSLSDIYPVASGTHISINFANIITISEVDYS